MDSGGRHFSDADEPNSCFDTSFRTIRLSRTMALSGGPKDGGELKIHENVDELTTDLADYIADLSEISVKERGFFAIALSGGSLISLMGKLCETPYNKTVDWAKWYIFWADERVVAKNHAGSNYKLAKDGLLSKKKVAMVMKKAGAKGQFMLIVFLLILFIVLFVLVFFT